jgi:hypothetical protein
MWRGFWMLLDAFFLVEKGLLVRPWRMLCLDEKLNWSIPKYRWKLIKNPINQWNYKHMTTLIYFSLQICHPAVKIRIEGKKNTKKEKKKSLGVWKKPWGCSYLTVSIWNPLLWSRGHALQGRLCSFWHRFGFVNSAAAPKAMAEAILGVGRNRKVHQFPSRLCSAQCHRSALHCTLIFSGIHSKSCAEIDHLQAQSPRSVHPSFNLLFPSPRELLRCVSATVTIDLRASVMLQWWCSFCRAVCYDLSL